MAVETSPDMADVEITAVIEESDGDDDDVTSYIAEYTISGYSNTFRTDPIPADEYDEEALRERVRSGASTLVTDEGIRVYLPDETPTDSEGFDRRQALAYGGALLVGGGAVAVNLLPDGAVNSVFGGDGSSSSASAPESDGTSRPTTSARTTTSETDSTETTSTRTSTTTSQSTLEREWAVEIGGRHTFLGESRIYHSGEGVGAVDTETGERAWFALADQPMGRTDGFAPSEAPIVTSAGGPVFALGTDGGMDSFTLFALGRDGSLLGKRELSSGANRLVPSPRGTILDAPERRSHTPSADGVTDYCDFGGGTTSQPDESLESAWEFDRPRNMCRMSSAVATDTHLVVKTDLFVRVFSLPDGDVQWGAPIDIAGRNFAVTPRYAILPTLNDGVRRYDLETSRNRQLWEGEAAGVAVADDFEHTFVLADDVVAVDMGGTPRWIEPLVGAPIARPYLVDGSLVVATDEAIRVHDAADGTVLFESETPEFVVDGGLRAVHCDSTGLYLRGGETLAGYAVTW